MNKSKDFTFMILKKLDEKMHNFWVGRKQIRFLSVANNLMSKNIKTFQLLSI